MAVRVAEVEAQAVRVAEEEARMKRNPRVAEAGEGLAKRAVGAAVALRRCREEQVAEAEEGPLRPFGKNP